MYEKEEKIKFLRENGYSYREILRKVRVSKRLITKIVKQTEFSKKGRKRYYNKIKGIIIPIKKQNKKLSLNKIRIIGNLLFDGSVYKTGYSYNIMYVNSSCKLVRKFCKDMKKVYGLTVPIYEEEGKTKIYRAKVNSKLAFLDLLNYMKSYSTSCNQCNIPEKILRGNKKIKLEFLRTFWDNEGSISKAGRLMADSANLNVINTLNELHKELGFNPNICNYIKNDSHYYKLYMPKNNLKKFYKLRLFTDSIVTKGYFKGMKKINVVKRYI